MFYEVIPRKLFRKDHAVLTYSFPSPLSPGTIVQIPLGNTTTIGLIVKKVVQPPFPTKPISKVLYSTPLPLHLIKALFWLSDYYLCPLPTILNLMLPAGLTKNRRKYPSSEKTEQTPKLPLISLNEAQKIALKGLQQPLEGTKLLHGVTGSGKTNIYLEMAKNALLAQKSVIILVPEIALTSQLVRVFSETFGQQTVLIHSKQTESERHQIWESLLNNTSPQIIIGPRSALFAPLSNLGLIIIDEAHESAYFQENPPRYSALRLASFIANSEKIPCILGTATPLVADYYLAKSKKSLISLTKKAKTTAITPDIKIINLGDRQNFLKNRYFSDALLASLDHNLKNHHQTLIFHNRRGSAPLTICEKCGWQALCPTCFLPLTLHSDSYELICHTCGYTSRVPHSCPSCHHPNIIHKGFGTKLLESELKKLLPQAKIARFDADNKKNETLTSLYQDLYQGDIDIIIGTQSIAKGLDLPHLATVGIVMADAGLALPDYASEERIFQLLTQVIGRVGRGHLNSAKVFIQTYQPDHPAINFALSADYLNFAKYLLQKRRKTLFPPFSYLAELKITYKTEKTTISKIRHLHHDLLDSSKNSKNLQISAPTPVFHERTASGYSWQIVIKSSSRTTLIDLIKPFLNQYPIHLTLDPPSLI